MTTPQIDELYAHNVSQFTQMERDSGNMVKQLLYEIQDHGFNTYIRLRDPVENGSVVFYKLVQGDSALVPLYAETLGFTSCSDERLEV